jgi:flavin-dependent dehydrogenase
MGAQVGIIGGGLAGLVASIQLARKGISCVLFEKKKYPFHRVCGEYISNEALPFLQREHLVPADLDLPRINQFLLSSTSGKYVLLPLDMGGFGISRYVLDHHLYTVAVQNGVEVRQETEVTDVSFASNRFHISTHSGQVFNADFVLGSFGKRSRLDAQLHRSFMKARSPYAAVKYHARTDHPTECITLHNFAGGYCGVSRVEHGTSNICYLTHRDNLRRYGSIRAMEENVVFKNPHLKTLFRDSDFLFEKPETINEISFATKSPVHHHMLMVGDAAGMITPLCGNGMAMAIHSAKIASDVLFDVITHRHAREWMEQTYARLWTKAFTRRLRFGRFVQHYLFGNELSSHMALTLAVRSTWLAQKIIKNTHGDVF